MFLRKNQRGAALTEYGILAGLIAIVAIAAVIKFGKTLEFWYQVDTLVVYEVTEPLGNYLQNGDFSDTWGMDPRAWGFTGPELEGWERLNSQPFELHSTGWEGMHSTTGDFWLDTNASPGGIDIQQEVPDLNPGEVYRLTITAGDRDPRLRAEALIFWNGTLVGRIDPQVENVMQDHDFYIREGIGNGTNRVRIMGVDDNSNSGVSIDQVRIWGR